MFYNACIYLSGLFVLTFIIHYFESFLCIWCVSCDICHRPWQRPSWITCGRSCRTRLCLLSFARLLLDTWEVSWPEPSSSRWGEFTDTCLRAQMQQVQVFNGFFSHSVSMMIPIALCGPAWIYWAPGSISTSTARTAVGNKSAVTSACTGPSTLPARLSSTRSSSDTEHCWRPTWRKVE